MLKHTYDTAKSSFVRVNAREDNLLECTISFGKKKTKKTVRLVGGQPRPLDGIVLLYPATNLMMAK